MVLIGIVGSELGLRLKQKDYSIQGQLGEFSKTQSQNNGTKQIG